MRSTDALRLPLLVTAIYALAVGVVQLFPALAEVVFARAVVDPAVESLYGTALIGMGALILAVAMEANRSRTMATIVVGILLLGAVDLMVFWSLGQLDTATALIPLILNLVLALWVGSSARGSRAGGATAKV